MDRHELALTASYTLGHFSGRTHVERRPPQLGNGMAGEIGLLLAAIRFFADSYDAGGRIAALGEGQLAEGRPSVP